MSETEKKESTYMDKGAFAGFFLFIVLARLIKPDMSILLTALIGGAGAAFGCLLAIIIKPAK